MGGTLTPEEVFESTVKQSTDKFIRQTRQEQSADLRKPEAYWEGFAAGAHEIAVMLIAMVEHGVIRVKR